MLCCVVLCCAQIAIGTHPGFIKAISAWQKVWLNDLKLAEAQGVLQKGWLQRNSMSSHCRLYSTRRNCTKKQFTEDRHSPSFLSKQASGSMTLVQQKKSIAEFTQLILASCHTKRWRRSGCQTLASVTNTIHITTSRSTGPRLRPVERQRRRHQG